MKPKDVTSNDNANLWNRMYLPKPEPDKKQRTSTTRITKKRPFRYDIGDTVKVASEKTKFKRGYDTNFSFENFFIAERDIRQGLEVYTIKDRANDVILGKWYPQELQRVEVNDDENYTIETVLKRRKYHGKKQLLVKWLGLDKKFNSWIDEDSVEHFK